MSQPEVTRLPMPTWLDVLSAVLPAHGVLLVGAGMGNGPWVQWLKDRRVSPVHLVEGDPRQYQHLTSNLPRIDGWTSWRDVAAASTGPVTFYQASNPAESGLLQPEALHEFWPHLDTDHSVVADTTVTLDDLDAVTDFAINWLILDCLPASDLLQGGRQLLAKLDVALVRVVLGQGSTLETARHDAVDGVLRAAGLTCCHVQAERNPALAHALYVRDTGHQARIAQELVRQANDLLEQKNQILEECSQALEHAKATLEQERQTAAKYQEQVAGLAANQEQEVQRLRQANDLLEHTLEERGQALEHVQALLEQERQAAAKHQETTAELTANQGQEIQRLRQANDLLEQKNHTLEERGQALEHVQALLEQERQAAAKHQETTAELTANQGLEIQRLWQANDLLEQKNQILEERSQELERVQALLEQERQAAVKYPREIAELAANQGQEIQRLRQANDLLEQKNQALEERSQELERVQALLEQERQAAAKYQKTTAELTANQGQEIQRLQQANDLLEQKNQTLKERNQELERVQALLEQERQAAVKHQREIAELAANQGQEIQRLWQANDLLKQKNQTLEDRSQELERVQALLEQERHAAARHQEKIADLAVNHGQEMQQLRQANDLLEQKNYTLEERNQELERVQALLEQEKQILLEPSKNIETLNSENVNRLNEIVSEVKIQNTQIEKAVQNLIKQLDAGLKNTVQQIESCISIESYLTRGKLALPMHGWPVSADFALCLIELIEAHHYDLIIEFGSGTSTVLMARVMAKMIKQRQPMKQLAGQEVIGYEEAPGVSRSVPPQTRSAPIESWPPIMSFDHDRKFYDQTLNRLRQEGLEYLVELSHSPLRDYVATSGDHFLYYACEEKFAALAKQLAGQHPRILVVVDGPPGATNPHARYPAMPIILQHLAEYRLDVLLDDYSRKEEKEIVDRWIELLNQRSLKYDKQNLAFEKGACLLSIE